MKRFIGLAAMAIAIGAGAANAQSFDKGYVELGLGVTTDKDFQFGAQTSPGGREPISRASAGFDDVLGPVGFRIDYINASVATGLLEEMNVDSVMLNATFNAPVSDWLTLYAAAGAGIAMNDYHGGGIGSQFPGLDSDDSQLAFQVSGGARAKLFNSPLSLFLEGQYQASGDFEITPTATAEYSTISGIAGLRWSF
jgi:opacity protein-like surface antigen